MFKFLPFLALSVFICGCGALSKSEEAITLKIDTSSMLRGRTITSEITIDNSDKVEKI